MRVKQGTEVTSARSEGKTRLAANVPAQTASDVTSDPILGYKLRVLIHDVMNVTKNPASARRLNSTTDEYYISTPYFTADEANIIKNVTVDIGPNLHYVSAINETEIVAAELTSKSIHEALGMFLAGFLEKRRASGDARPRGPHHLAPLYAVLFNIPLGDLNEAKFLARLRRNGI